ncbi:MAG: patatin-like phospholipase family protein [Burkholderiales bacterium]|nr:patatin-like phospholipase family protein [Burkholderiales bacterium]
MPFRILSLDGGGAKGFYTLGILREIEAMIGCPIHEKFDLIFGTSTGAIIASMLTLGKSVEEVHDTYKEHVPTVMGKSTPSEKSKALSELAEEVYGDATFADMKTKVGIVATRWVEERPMIFKSDVAQAHGRHDTFVPGFGVPVKKAVQASCSAYPFFDRVTVRTSQGDDVELIDGGYCANNPTLYAIAEATVAMKVPVEELRVVSLGVGTYPAPKLDLLSKAYWANKIPSVKLAQKMFEINTQSIEQLRAILYKHIATVRISQSYTEPKMAADMFEHNLAKLNVLRQRGAQSYAEHEAKLKQYLL